MAKDIDPRVDPGWDGPTPRYESTVSLAPSVSREELIVYFSHTMAQVIDAMIVAGDEGRRMPPGLPEDSPWDRDWAGISEMDMTETEVSFLLSDLDGDALRNMANLALGIALDRVLEEHGPAFMLYATSTLLGMVAREGEKYAVRPDPEGDG